MWLPPVNNRQRRTAVELECDGNSSRSRGDCNQADIKEAYHRGVLVLTAEDLKCLLQDPGAPDYATFRAKLYLQLIGRTGRSKFVAAPEVLEQMRVVDLD